MLYEVLCSQITYYHATFLLQINRYWDIHIIDFFFSFCITFFIVIANQRVEGVENLPVGLGYARPI